VLFLLIQKSMFNFKEQLEELAQCQADGVNVKPIHLDPETINDLELVRKAERSGYEK
jgi:hypothetical protein